MRTSLVIGLVLAGSASAQITGHATVEYTTPSVSLPIPLGVAAYALGACSNLDYGDLGLTLSLSNAQGSSTADVSLDFSLVDAITSLLQSGGQFSPSLPTDVGCSQTFVQDLGVMRGNIGLYSFHAGSGGPLAYKFMGDISAHETFEHFSPIATTVELPLHISGDVFGAESFGNPTTTEGYAKMELSGSFAGAAIPLQTVEATSVSVIPTQASISQDLRIPVAVQPGLNHYSIDITGTVEVRASAQGTGLFGLISGAATAGADFQNTIRIGNIEGVNGAPLPPCTEIRGMLNGGRFVRSDGTVYCTAKTNSLGCVPSIESSGTPSASGAGPFVVTVRNVINNKSGMLIYSLAGRNASPFQGGLLCIRQPVRRTLNLNSGGNPGSTSDCSGVLSFDMNLFASGAMPVAPAPELQQVGTQVNCQWWSRDPGFAPPQNTSLSDALEYAVCL